MYRYPVLISLRPGRMLYFLSNGVASSGASKRGPYDISSLSELNVLLILAALSPNTTPAELFQ